jgi:hypothetical protein
MEASLTVFVVAALVGGTVLWVWALADVLTHRHVAAYRSGNQIVWALVIALTHAIGAALYLAMGRRWPLPRGHR